MGSTPCEHHGRINLAVGIEAVAANSLATGMWTTSGQPWKNQLRNVFSKNFERPNAIQKDRCKKKRKKVSKARLGEAKTGNLKNQ